MTRAIDFIFYFIKTSNNSAAIPNFTFLLYSFQLFQSQSYCFFEDIHVSPGADQGIYFCYYFFWLGGGEVRWGSHQTVLSFICSKTLLIRKDKLEPATLQTLAIPQNKKERVWSGLNALGHKSVFIFSLIP